MNAIVPIKPLSVNECWQGRRFKTKKYLSYESSVLFLLPNVPLPEKPYKIVVEWHFSNLQSDIDNPTKPFLDILQKKYKFNDKDVYELVLKKCKANVGQEKIVFTIDTW